MFVLSHAINSSAPVGGVLSILNTAKLVSGCVTPLAVDAVSPPFAIHS
jgi:hypothetical protein